jgi:hypothetical protein
LPSTSLRIVAAANLRPTIFAMPDDFQLRYGCPAGLQP